MEKGLFKKFCGVFISSHEVIKLQIFESGVGDVILANIQNNSFPAVYYGATWHIFKPKLKIKIKYPLKKVLYVLIFWKMEFSSSNIRKFLIFYQKKGFLLFQETETPKQNFSIVQMEMGNGHPKKFLIFQEVTFRTRKMKKPTLKKLLTFREMELSSPKLKKMLIFQERTWKA